MAEVFIVVLTSGSSTLQRLRTTRVTATSGRLRVGMEGRERKGETERERERKRRQEV